MTTKIVFPIVNLNGDDKETLLTQMEDLVNALNVVNDKLSDSYPHGRNYQCNDVDDYRNARNQHNQWRAAISIVIKEATALYHNIYDQ